VDNHHGQTKLGSKTGALSRMHDVGESSENQEIGLAAMVYFPWWLDVQKVMECIRSDPSFKEIVDDLLHRKLSEAGYLGDI
jgi:hypothetical protein